MRSERRCSLINPYHEYQYQLNINTNWISATWISIPIEYLPHSNTMLPLQTIVIHHNHMQNKYFIPKHISINLYSTTFIFYTADYTDISSKIFCYHNHYHEYQCQLNICLMNSNTYWISTTFKYNAATSNNSDPPLPYAK